MEIGRGHPLDLFDARVHCLEISLEWRSAAAAFLLNSCNAMNQVVIHGFQCSGYFLIWLWRRRYHGLGGVVWANLVGNLLLVPNERTDFASRLSSNGSAIDLGKILAE